MQTRLFIQLSGLALAVLLTLLVGSAAPQGTPNVIKGSPIVLDLSPSGGGQLQIGNNINDNKIFLEGFSSDGNGHASEMLITGRFAQSLPLFSVLADIMRLLGTVQIGENINAAFTFEPADASPNAGYLRFGDNTGWKLHFGRSRENTIVTGAPLNTGTTGVLMTLQDNGNAGIGTTAPTQKLDVAGTIRSSSGGFMFPDGTTQTTATLRGPQGPRGPAGPPGPPTKTSAVCVGAGAPQQCSCSNTQVSFVFSPCTVTSETGTCSATSAGTPGNIQHGSCCVCAP